MEGDPNLRSRESIQGAFILFANKTQRLVDVNWVDYEGRFVRYITLNPGTRTTINTFSTHPWIFKDSNTGERMHVENKDVYWPKPFVIRNYEYNNRLHIQAIQREQIDIHFPMRTLLLNALWNVVKQITDVDIIEQLEIPNILKTKLKILFLEYDKNRKNRGLSSSSRVDGSDAQGPRFDA